eukprot:CAMPEP_0194760690 /NCGR_PEP_ID=MMETSP0323_2-20130528/13550_1 /TAXON_ID=2866 ORGANISM="Crypthecodinium cohnii, Strain Seligo" /NCGR_SAMPLE_ID=MMETSP0323_2 /ASSEMBLY_ACC=CAM_ASM_000346 /LENGTH=46 /DNA_ID= /DNA_START= /DNA_END= /DNA_ORIENTATION=
MTTNVTSDKCDDAEASSTKCGQTKSETDPILSTSFEEDGEKNTPNC